MFNLQTGIHFKEVEVFLAIDDELHRPGGAVIHRLRQRDGLFAHGLAGGGVEEGARRLFNDLLVPALDRAFAFIQVNCVAVFVAEDLNFDMARLRHEFLDEDAVVAKTARRLVLGGLEALARLIVVPSDAHALAAAPGGGLDHHRITNLVGDLHCFLGVFDQAHIAGHGRNTGFLRQLFRGDLVAHGFDRARRRADEGDALFFQRLGEELVFA